MSELIKGQEGREGPEFQFGEKENGRKGEEMTKPKPKGVLRRKKRKKEKKGGRERTKRKARGFEVCETEEKFPKKGHVESEKFYGPRYARGKLKREIKKTRK